VGDVARSKRTVLTIARRTCASALAVALVFHAASGAVAEPTTDLRASYAITLAIFTIGNVDISGHFTSSGYSADIKGSTSGLGRLVSDSRAELRGDGAFAGSRVVSSTYSLRTAEADFFTRVDMSLHEGAPSKLDVDPTLLTLPDRVPLTPDAMRHVFDPVSALIVIRDGQGTPDGKAICNRSIPVFDGWVRYDVALSYKETTNFVGRAGRQYNGPAIICQARYVPVGGHRLNNESVQFMAQNKRLEAWMVPIKGTSFMVPIKIIIGTNLGDLAVTARDFVVSAPPAAGPAVTTPPPATR